MKILTCGIQKGGCAKSTTAQVIADILGSQGKRVLLIDLDPQRNSTYSCGVFNPDKSVTDVLGGDCTAEDAVIKCKYHDLLAADEYLSNVQSAVVDTSLSDSAKRILDESGIPTVSMTLLRDKLLPVQSEYDLIVIDVPPSLGNLTYMALVASTDLLIPTEATSYGQIGLFDLNKTIKSVQQSYNRDLNVVGLVLTRYAGRTSLGSDVKTMVREWCDKQGYYLFNATVRESTIIRQSQMMQIPLIDHAPKANVTLDYIALCKELVERLGV